MVTVSSGLTPTVNSSTICVGQTATLTAAGATSYTWAPSPGLSTTTGATITVKPTTNTNYTLYASNGICTGINTAHVYVNALPLIKVGNASLCLRQQTATLTASGGTTYTWSPISGLNISNGNTVQAQPIKTTTYVVTGMDANACINKDTTIVTVYPLPTINISPVSVQCVPFCPVIQGTSYPPAKNLSWDLGNGQIPLTTTGISSSSFSVATCYTVAGTYAIHLTVTDSTNCSNNTVASIKTPDQPIADFDYTPKPVNILSPEVHFIDQSGAGIQSYTWNFGDLLSPGGSTLANPTHAYTDTGSYSVSLTVVNFAGCSASVVKPVLIEEDYSIYVPNAFSPNADGKNEIFKPAGEGILAYELYIFDRWGMLVFQSDDLNKGWDGTNHAGNIAQQDIYVWKIDLRNFKNQRKSLTGTVSLIQ